MELFENIITELRTWIDAAKGSQHPCAEYPYARMDWPAGTRGNIVLMHDTGVELGNPQDESVSFVLWTTDITRLRDGTTTIIGPDVTSCPGKTFPFGKVVLIGVDGFTTDNCYERHRELEMVRYDVNLKGYMMRSASQYMKEWSRVSTEALEKGFSLKVLASNLMDRYREIHYVTAAEVLFVTSSPEQVRSLQDLGQRAARIMSAMNKMASELSFDCGTCDYTDVCGEVEALKSMRQSMKKEMHHG